jgi:hypothetical protein
MMQGMFQIIVSTDNEFISSATTTAEKPFTVRLWTVDYDNPGTADVRHRAAGHRLFARRRLSTLPRSPGRTIRRHKPGNDDPPPCPANIAIPHRRRYVDAYSRSGPSHRAATLSAEGRLWTVGKSYQSSKEPLNARGVEAVAVYESNDLKARISSGQVNGSAGWYEFF